jgi:hypothetical protein
MIFIHVDAMAMIWLEKGNQNRKKKKKNHGQIKEVPISSEDGIFKLANYKSKTIQRN